MTMIFSHPIRCSYLQVVGCMTFVCLNTPSDDLSLLLLSILVCVDT